MLKKNNTGSKNVVLQTWIWQQKIKRQENVKHNKWNIVQN